MEIMINPYTRDVSHNTTPRSGAIEYIVLHYVGATGSALANVQYYSQPSTTSGSADYYIGHDGEIVQYNPEPRKRYTWAVGKKWYDGAHGAELWGKCSNANSIHIEMCVRCTGPQVANAAGWYFEDATINAARLLVRQLMAEHGIPIERVTTHHHVAGKACPGVIGWNSASGSESAWEAFRASLIADPEYPVWVGHVIRVGDDTLTVRTGPGVEFYTLAAWPQLGDGNQVDVIGEEWAVNGYLWYKIRIAGKHEGYVNASYIWPDQGAYVAKVVDCLTLNVRTGPAMSYGLYKHQRNLGPGNLVDVIGQIGDWCRIRIGEKHIAYVHSAYLKQVH